MSLGNNYEGEFSPSSVLSWLKAVDNSNRAQLLLVCNSWSSPDSAMLISELVNQCDGKSMLGYDLENIPKQAILSAIGLLSDKDIPRLSAIVAGLSLIER